MERLLTEKIRIVLAEDDADQRQILTRLLEQVGCTVLCAASNGVELLTFCEQHEADVALLDFDMPLLDGLETAEVLQQRGIPVVLISGLAESSHLVVDLEPIATRLFKPVKSEELQKAIQVALATKS